MFVETCFLLSYLKAFDGAALVITQAHPHVDMSSYPVLGTILSHGFLVSGVLPVRIAFPVLAAVLLHPTVSIPDLTYIFSLADYLSSYEGANAFDCLKKDSPFTPKLTDDLTGVLSRLGCLELPTPSNLRRVITDVARHEFLAKPLRAVYALRGGVPAPHFRFWEQFTIDDLYCLYLSLYATPANVIAMIEEPDAVNSAQQTVFGYLVWEHEWSGTSQFPSFCDRKQCEDCRGHHCLVQQPVWIGMQTNRPYLFLPVGHSSNIFHLSRIPR